MGNKKPSTVSVVPADFVPPAPESKREKRVFTGVIASCQLMLVRGGGLFEFTLPPDDTTISVGRQVDQTDNHIVVNLGLFNGFEMGVSRNHARFERSGSRLFIRDLGSTNGTWVNGKRLVAHHVHEIGHGDQIEFGRLPAKLFVKA